MVRFIVDLLLRSAAFRKHLSYAAFKVAYASNTDTRAKLKHAFTDSTGASYYEWIDHQFIPLSRYEQAQIRLMEMDARISREDLKAFSETAEEAANKGDMVAVGQLFGELKVRLDVLYDPDLMIRLLSGLYIREDQIDTAHIWNQDQEDAKAKQLMADNDSGALVFFSTGSDSLRLLESLIGSNLDSRMWSPPVVKNQTRRVRLFREMVAEIRASFSELVSLPGERTETPS